MFGCSLLGDYNSDLLIVFRYLVKVFLQNRETVTDLVI